MNFKNVWLPLFVVAVLCDCVLPASASERLCDASFEDCRAPLVKLIQNENVEIDVAFWFMDDTTIAGALMQKIKAGVPVRMLVDPRADGTQPPNLTILQQFAAMKPPSCTSAACPVPMRQRVAPGILHWKMMLFAGQGVVEFSGANFSAPEFVAPAPYKTYDDEAIYFSDDAAIVNSFRTQYDNWWIDTTDYADYANTSGMQLVRSYAIYPIEVESCKTVTGGCGLNFLPASQSYLTKAQSAINAETVKLDIDMYRITNAAITDTTIAAFKRGIPIRMLVDSSEYSNPTRVWDRYNVDRLFMAGIPMKLTRHGGQNHEKSLMFYGQGLVVWGSSNWTTPSSNSQQEHNYFSTSAVKSWFFPFFVNQFERRWNSPQEYRAFVPIGPGVPVYKNPPNSATGVSQSVTLSWDEGPWGQMFDIYLAAGATASPKLIASNVVTGNPDPVTHVLGTFKVSGLAPQTQYRWQVVSKTMANLTATGPVWSFTTGGTPPTSGATVNSICVPSGQTCGPAVGPSIGGTPVTITGTNFSPGPPVPTVSFGFATASNVAYVNSTTITATTPPGSATGGSANVTVTNSSGVSGSLPGGFVYTPNPISTTPRINVVVPNTGSPAGGTAITISGSNFVPGTTVTIGGAPSTITGRQTVSIQATTPPGNPGAPVDIVVTTPNGSTTLPAAFTYVNPPDPPMLNGMLGTDANRTPISSGTANGGSSVILTGSGFRYGAVVSFGGPPPPIGTGIRATTVAVTNSATVCGHGVPLPCIIATTPPFAAVTSDVVVTNMNPDTGVIDSGSGISTLTAGYTFVPAPSISRVSPSGGTVSGGTQITISGVNIQAGATVFVGNQTASIQSTSGTTSITATVPANSAGTLPVTVMNPNGQSSNTLIFTYQ